MDFGVRDSFLILPKQVGVVVLCCACIVDSERRLHPPPRYPPLFWGVGWWNTLSGFVILVSCARLAQVVRPFDNTLPFLCSSWANGTGIRSSSDE
jgi:hypothetical protein